MSHDSSKLRDLYDRFGDSLFKDRKKLKALMLDYQIPKKNINLLIDITKVEYFQTFLKPSGNSDATAEINRLFHHVKSEFAFQDSQLYQAIVSWAYALHLIQVLPGNLEDYVDAGPANHYANDEKGIQLVANAIQEMLKKDEI